MTISTHRETKNPINCTSEHISFDRETKPIWVNTFDQMNFYIDIEGHLEDQSVQKALEELGFHTQKLDILGVYEAHKFRFKN